MHSCTQLDQRYAQVVSVELHAPQAKRNVRTSVLAHEPEACENLVDLQTHSQRLAALVANLLAVCIRTVQFQVRKLLCVESHKLARERQ
eukprot:1542388-Pleurochrysis_carterae.AAC.1